MPLTIEDAVKYHTTKATLLLSGEMFQCPMEGSILAISPNREFVKVGSNRGGFFGGGGTWLAIRSVCVMDMFEPTELIEARRRNFEKLPPCPITKAFLNSIYDDIMPFTIRDEPSDGKDDERPS